MIPETAVTMVFLSTLASSQTPIGMAMQAAMLIGVSVCQSASLRTCGKSCSDTTSSMAVTVTTMSAEPNRIAKIGAINMAEPNPAKPRISPAISVTPRAVQSPMSAKSVWMNAIMPDRGPPGPLSQDGPGGPRSSELRPHEIDAVLAPEQLAVDHEGRHSEHARCLGRLLMLGRQLRPLVFQEGIEACRIDAHLLQKRVDGGAILVVELAPEEPRIGEIDELSPLAAPVGKQPGHVNEPRVEDLLRSRGCVMPAREAADIGIEILDLAQPTLQRRRIVGVHAAHDLEMERPQAHRDAQLLLESVGRILGDERVRTC